jgi:phasin family protein
MATKTTYSKPFFPVFDTDQLLAVQQRNVDAMTSASQIVVDGVKALALRQSEMLQSSVEEWVSTGQQAWNGKPGEVKPAEYVTRAKSQYEALVNNAKELTDIAVKAQSEAFGVLTKAMMANLDDLKTVAKTA